MKLWISGEVEADIFEKFRVAINSIEHKVNAVIEGKSYFKNLDGWDVIAIIRNDEYFNEITKYSAKKEEMDFRLRVNYLEFKNADDIQTFDMIIIMLNRSLDILIQKGLNKEGIVTLKTDLYKEVSKLFK